MKDISIFIELPVEGSDVVCLLVVHDPTLPHLEVSSTSQTSYSSAIWKWRTSTEVPSTIEHIEFLWILLCHFVFFPHSSEPSIERFPLARALAIRSLYALGTIFLASLYQAMGKYVTKIHYHKVGGALWFVQIWLFAYFLEISGADSFPSMSLGLSAVQSIRTISTDSLSFFFLSLVDRSFSQLYLKPDTISNLSWQHILSSFAPYLLDFKYPSSFLNTFYRVLISRGCYAFSP